MRRVLLPVALFAVSLFLAACTRGATQPNTITYALDPVSSAVSGTVTFEKMSATETRVTIEVAGTTAGQEYPAHVHVGSHPGGDIYITLTSVDGATGTSSTVVTQTDTGAAVDYEHLVNYDGYVNVHLADGTVIATGETGAGANDVQVDPNL